MTGDGIDAGIDIVSTSQDGKSLVLTCGDTFTPGDYDVEVSFVLSKNAGSGEESFTVSKTLKVVQA